MKIPSDKEWATMTPEQHNQFAAVFNAAVSQVVAQIMISSMPMPPQRARDASGREMVLMGDANASLLIAGSALCLLAFSMGIPKDALLLHVDKQFEAAHEAERAGQGSSQLMKLVGELVHQTVKAVAEQPVIVPAQA